MKRLLSAAVILILVLTATSAFATSTGSMTFNAGPASCTATPAIWDSTIGAWVGSTLNGGYGPMTVNSTVQVPNSNTGLLITPSLDTGLFTSTKINTNTNNATADVGIMVCVNVTDSNGKAMPVMPTNCIVYDQRIQQISSQLFSQLSQCNTTTACTSNAQCPNSNYSCVGGYCQNNLCDFSLLLTTLSAHSYNFVAPVPVGTYNVATSWYPIGQNQSTTGGTTNWCVGPFNVTVQQVNDPAPWSSPTVYPSIGR